MKQPVGRPIKPNAFCRIGKSFKLNLTSEQMDFLDEILTSTGISKAETVRKLIQNEMSK